MLAIWLLFLEVLALPLQVLTATGARRRGQSRLLAGVAGLFFPLTWTVWYLRDERPRFRRRRPASAPAA